MNSDEINQVPADAEERLRLLRRLRWKIVGNGCLFACIFALLCLACYSILPNIAMLLVVWVGHTLLGNAFSARLKAIDHQIGRVAFSDCPRCKHEFTLDDVACPECGFGWPQHWSRTMQGLFRATLRLAALGRRSMAMPTAEMAIILVLAVVVGLTLCFYVPASRIPLLGLLILVAAYMAFMSLCYTIVACHHLTHPTQLASNRTLMVCPECSYDIRITPGRCSECGWGQLREQPNTN